MATSSEACALTFAEEGKNVRNVFSNVRPKSLKFFDQFGITIPCSATYLLEVGARVSLKVATKACFFESSF